MTRANEINIDLKGLRVLVTRPKPMGEQLCEWIETLGGHAIYFPTIQFGPATNPLIAARQLAKIDKQDWLIFISAQAVHMSETMLQAYWPIFPAHVSIAAVGGGTVSALHKAHLPVACYPTAQWGSEGLLLLPQLQAVAGKKIAIVRGEGGHDWLAHSLKARGAIVSSIVVYQRQLPVVAVDDYEAMLRAQQMDVIVCTSGEGLRNTKELLKNAWAELAYVPVVVISPRMQVIAQDLGFKKILLADNASHSGIIAALYQSLQ